jgi:catechol-2,3-dioxygenase
MSTVSGPPGTGSPVHVNKIGFLSMRSRDVAALAGYYTRVLGLKQVTAEKGAAYLTTGPEHHCLEIVEGEPHGRAALGLQVHGELGEVERSLGEAGVAAERRSDPMPGVGDAVVVTEPLTGTPVLLYSEQAASGAQNALGPRPTKLGHVAGYVPALGPLRAFWEEALGFRFSDMIGDFFVFLRCNPDHHTVNLMESAKRSGLHHAAYEVRDFMHLKEMLDQLASHEVRLEWGPGRHGAGHNIFTYHRDPDGNVVELFTELDVVHDEDSGNWEPRPWHEEFPQGPKVWEPSPGAANKWGPINPEMLDH